MTNRKVLGGPAGSAERWTCPFCGPRARSEFDRIDAPAAAPSLQAGAGEWFAALHLQDGPRAHTAEETFWTHALGCGAVLALSSATGPSARFASPVFAEAMRSSRAAPTEALPKPARRRAAATARRRLAS